MVLELKLDLHLLALIGIFALVGIAFAIFQATRDNGQAAGTGDGAPGLQFRNSPQDVYVKALADGTYDKSEIRVKAGVPVRLHFSTEPQVGCGQELVIRGLNVRLLGYPDRDSVIEFTPTQPGRYPYSCGMGMWSPGVLIVE